MEISPDGLPWGSIYKIMIGAILPRPIGWISSIDPNGIPNLAPFSFFNAICPNPPHVLFCPMIRGTDSRQKDTLCNVRATGEFVVNIATLSLAEAVNLSSAELLPGESEFELAGLELTPSMAVRAPRVAASPIHFECRMSQVIDIGDEPGGGSVVIGSVVHLHVDESVLIGSDKIDLDRLQPFGRLAGDAYCRVTDRFVMKRPPSRLVP
jgi:flavin reductase (DIM6/NTAB) family NADH-FMN oxidoreductase RutF